MDSAIHTLNIRYGAMGIIYPSLNKQFKEIHGGNAGHISAYSYL